MVQYIGSTYHDYDILLVLPQVSSDLLLAKWLSKTGSWGVLLYDATILWYPQIPLGSWCFLLNLGR